MDHLTLKPLWVACVAVLLAASCATTPTGRKQIILVPDSEMNQMGVQAFAEMKQQVPQETDPTYVDYVKCVAMPIVAQSKDATGVDKWEVVVFKDESANAFALPGGKIGVHTGIIKVATTPDQLAAVLGHEVGHVIARHGAERISESGLAESALQILGGTLGTGADQQLLLGALGMGAQYGVLMPHGRNQESEADIIGLELMAKAGFDPKDSVELWKNMSKAGGQQPPEFLSTHPSNERRIDDLKKNIPRVQKYYDNARNHPKCTRPS